MCYSRNGCLKWLLCGSFHSANSDEDLLTPAIVNSQLIQEAGLVFSCSTLGDVTPGTSFYISGHTQRNCERFSINLTLGLHSNDIALHINPRLPQNYIVRNCKINSRWGKEEVTSALPFCLCRGHPFAVQILVTEAEYFISINGKHFAAFRHRLPYNRVACLQVKGDVTDIEVEQISVMEYPDRMCDLPLPTVRQMELIGNDEEWNFLNTKTIMAVPYTAKLSNPFDRGTNLHIFGRVKMLPHSFFLNLQKGDKIWPHPTIAFHLNPRFAHVGGQHLICQNSWLDNKWDREERSEIRSGFMPGQKFHLLIMATDSGYHIYLNEKFIADYRYRIEPNVVDTIYMQGDLHLYGIVLETKPITRIFNYTNDCNEDD